MKCPKCEAEGLKSVMRARGPSMRTLAHYPGFYDEDGAFHKHDRNISTSNYVCSNGHRLTSRSYSRCPAEGCAWNEKMAQQESDSGGNSESA
jgi:hypothetical protein